MRGLYGDCTGTVISLRFVRVRSSGASHAVVCQKLQGGFSEHFDGSVYNPPYGRPYDLNGKDTTGSPSGQNARDYHISKTSLQTSVRTSVCLDVRMSMEVCMEAVMDNWTDVFINTCMDVNTA